MKSLESKSSFHPTKGKKAPKKNKGDLKNKKQQNEEEPTNTNTKDELRTAASKGLKKKVTDAKHKARANKANQNVKPKAQDNDGDSKSRSKDAHWIQAYQVDWLSSSGVRHSLSVNRLELDLEGWDYEELVELLIFQFAPSKIGAAYALIGPKCNVLVQKIDLNKEFNSKPKAMKMFKDMLINRHNMILQDKTVKIYSSDDEGVEEVSGNK